MVDPPCGPSRTRRAQARRTLGRRTHNLGGRPRGERHDVDPHPARGDLLIFWVMGVRDFGAYLRDAVRAGYSFSDTNHVHNEGYEYWIGAIGMEVVPHIPSVIEWKSRDDGEEPAATVGSRIVDFTVHHPEAQNPEGAESLRRFGHRRARPARRRTAPAPSPRNAHRRRDLELIGMSNREEKAMTMRSSKRPIRKR